MLDVSAFSQVLHLFLLITVSPMATNKTETGVSLVRSTEAQSWLHVAHNLNDFEILDPD